MSSNRIHNFNAGPAALPLPVLEEMQESFLDFSGSGMSIIEVSHRSKWFDDVINDASERVRRIFKLGSEFDVLFIPGGASMQFCMIPMNLLSNGESADYINTGIWSKKAIKEAEIQNKSINVVASSEDKNFSYIPKDILFNSDAKYVHLTSNNTIKGTQWGKFPNTGEVPLIADMSSDIFSRCIDSQKFGMIYAGVQKNLGAAGVCLVIIHKDFLSSAPEYLPTMLKYTTFSSNNSMFNTPPCFSIYSVQLVLKWIEEEIGGLKKMEILNLSKATFLYNFIDASSFYSGTAALDSRSIMNITWRLPNEKLEKLFLEKAIKNGIAGLKGHRSVGGCRASIYNATSLNSVKFLVDFMKDFEKKEG